LEAFEGFFFCDMKTSWLLCRYAG